MQPIYSIMTALAVTMIYVLWQRYSEARVQRQRTIRQRVTFMLWTMAALLN